MASRVHPVWLVLAGILSVQFGAGLAKTVFDEVSPTAIVWLRLSFSALVLVAFARPSLRGRSRDDWLVVAGFGIALAVMNWSFYEALDRIPLGVAVTIEFIGPLSLSVVGSRRARDLLWVGLAAIGVALLGLRGGGDVQLGGVLFALLAGGAWAAYILLNVRTGRRWSGFDGLATASVIAAVLLTPAALGGHADELTSGHVVLVGFLVGLLSSTIPYGLELVALRRLDPTPFAILLSLEPAAAALAGTIVLGEVLAALQWLAIACVIAASAGATLSSRPVVSEPAAS